MTAWESFWAELWSGEWAADTGLPLLITLGGLGFAYIAFRSQLKHDRELFALQLKADRDLAHFQRRRDIAIRYATEARAHADALDAAAGTFVHDDQDSNWVRFFTALLKLKVGLDQSVDIFATTIGRGPASTTAKTIARIHTEAIFAPIATGTTLPRLHGPDDDDLAGDNESEEDYENYRQDVSGSARFNRSRLAKIVAKNTARRLRAHANQLDTWDGSNKQPTPQDTLAELDLIPEATEPADQPLPPDRVEHYVQAEKDWVEAVRGELRNDIAALTTTPAPDL